jgi:Arc/MetJ-type ribon-helix-helix transcriptional regulator
MIEMFIGVRVPEELKLKLEELCEQEGKTLSELIRDTLEEYVQVKEEEWQKVKVCVKMPSKVYRQVGMFVDYGYYTSMDEAINSAVRLWLRFEKREYEEKWEEKLESALMGDK